MKFRNLGMAVLAVLAVALIPAEANAFSAPKVTIMKLAVEVTGVHLDEWHFQDEAFPDPSRIWSIGSGTQTLGFSTPKPTIYSATVISGSVPGGGSVPPLSLAKLGSSPLKGSLRRDASWRNNDGDPCDTEGKCDPAELVGQLHHKPSCPALRRAVPATLELSRPGGEGPEVLTVGFSTVAGLSSPWPNCPPDIDGVSRPLRLAQPRAVLLPGAAARISKLARGASVTFKGASELGAQDGDEAKPCPKLSGPGMRECATTDVTVEVQRIH